MSSRQCSLCNNNGHNSRTCTSTKAVKLFGVRLTEVIRPVKKSASTGNIAASSSGANRDHARSGYATDGQSPPDGSNDRKKGIPWSEEEHRRFLQGLEKLGKGDWRGISRTFVLTRTPTQVASHAQKHFNRQQNAYRSRKRSSLFDMVPDMAGDQILAPQQQANSPPLQTETVNECIPHRNVPLPVVPRFCPAPMPMPYALWPPMLIAPNQEMRQTRMIIKPNPVVHKERKGPDVTTDMSKLSIVEGMKSRIGPTEQ